MDFSPTYPSDWRIQGIEIHCATIHATWSACKLTHPKFQKKKKNADPLAWHHHFVVVPTKIHDAKLQIQVVCGFAGFSLSWIHVTLVTSRHHSPRLLHLDHIPTWKTMEIWNEFRIPNSQRSCLPVFLHVAWCDWRFLDKPKYIQYFSRDLFQSFTWLNGDSQSGGES